MAPSISVLYILFTVGFLTKWSTESTQLEFEVNFDNEPEDVVGIKGKPLALPCKPRTSQQKELVDIKWYHNNNPMDFTNDKRRTILENGTLYFSKLIHKKGSHTDEGEYRCVVDRENGSLSSKPGYLRISVLPESVSCSPAEQNVEAGSNVRLTCELEFLPELEIEWERNDYKLPQNKIKYATISGPDIRGSILYIFNVVPDDSGNYRCTAKNVLLNKRRHSSSSTLTVFPKQSNSNQRRVSFLSAPNYFSSLSSPVVKDVKEGENVTLDCVTVGYPIPTLTWTYSKDNHTKSVEIFNSTRTGHNIVEIRNITRYQAGWYTCSAINLSSEEIKIRLNVLTTPEIREYTGNLSFRASRTIRLRCLAYGVFVPEIYWLKDGNLFNITGRTKLRTSVNESEQLRYSELVVSSTIASDAGSYQCMAKNSVGSSWVVNRLTLNASKPAPMPPEKISCESISSSQVNVSWEVPNHVEKLKAFSIHYHLTDDGEEKQKVMRSDYRSHVIDRLLPYKNYTFYLRLYSESASEFSEKVFCQTGEEVPIDAPRTELKTVSPNTIHVTWSPLNKDKARGVVVRYKIQWRLTNALCSKVDQVAGDVLDYTITDLIPGNKYDVRVLAGTSKGWPYPNFPWKTIEVPLNNNINIPSAPKVTSQAVNFSSIEVKWSLSYNSAEVSGYKIYYRKENCSLVGPVVVPSDSIHYILRNLDAATWYEIMVMAFTKYYEGESGISSIHTLPKGEFSNGTTRHLTFILEPPVSLEADPISSKAITLTWKPHPASSGDYNVSYYTVCFNLVETSHINNATICLKSLTANVTIEGLDPFTLYEFKVRSHGLDDKQSVFSRTVECYSLEDVPSRVPEIIWMAVNKTATKVAWRVPLESNGILRNYTLYYTDNSNLPLNLWNVKVVPASNRSTMLTDLSANVKYYVIVRASTSAGYGPYDSPKPFIIPSINEIDRNEFATKSSKDKQNDHYVGIMVGLGIGLCCIMLCTTCILCRRRCLKNEMSQEFEVTSSRHGNGHDCHRDREFVAGSRETEYFTFLSPQREQADLKEISVEHIDNKALHPNTTSNGVRMSLLSEVRTSNGSSEKANICTSENSMYDSNCFEFPLLDARTQSNPSNRSNDMKFSRDTCSESKIPLLVKKQKPTSDTKLSFDSTTKHPAVVNLNCRKETSPGYPERKSFAKNKGNFSLQNSIDFTPDSDRLGPSENCTQQKLEEVEEEEEHWMNLSSVLQNPDFRFSDSNSLDKKKNRINGMKVGDKLFKDAVHVFKGNNGNNGNDEFKNHEIYDFYKNSRLSLHLKEITQES